MKTMKPAVAATELLLVFPAALFMTALFVRNLQPQQYEPAHTAQRIVDWYAASPHVGLWVLLIALPLVVLFLGVVTLARNWKADAELRQAAQQVAKHPRTRRDVVSHTGDADGRWDSGDCRAAPDHRLVGGRV